MINETHFLKKLKSITMSTAQKSRMRDKLDVYADMHSYVQPEATASPYAFLFAFMETKRFPLYASLMVALLITGSGMTFAAEQSAPGDSLYALKVHVTEPVLTVLSPSAEGQARISARLATRRADEVVSLATRGRLTAERENYLDEAFSKEVSKAVERSNQLEQKGDTEKAQSVRADLAVSLAGEAQALGAVSHQSGKDKGAFLRKIVATSQSVSGASETPDTLDNQDTSTTSTATTVSHSTTPKPLLGTTTEISLKKPALLRQSKEGILKIRPLFINASTTFSGILLAPSGLVVPKTDSILIQTQHEESNRDSAELRNVLGR